jgi:hypothetical protein
MAQHFGSGVLWATPQTDAYGSAIAMPTPFQFGILQDVSFDESFSQHLLRGQNSIPVDAARGEGTVNIKAKSASISILPYAAAFYGQSATTGLITSINDNTGQVAAATIAVTLPVGTTYFANMGVRVDIYGTPMIRVATAPTTGQYTCDGAGNYTFAAADFGKLVFIDFQVMSASAGKTFVMNNPPMGLNPTISLDFGMMRNGKVLTFTYHRVISSKFSYSSKLQDFIMPELDMMAIANAQGKIKTWSESA